MYTVIPELDWAPVRPTFTGCRTNLYTSEISKCYFILSKWIFITFNDYLRLWLSALKIYYLTLYLSLNNGKYLLLKAKHLSNFCIVSCLHGYLSEAI